MPVSMSSIVIIQARTNSTRLPGKVMLPISSIPIAVLAARRAANTGKKIIIATHDDTVKNICDVKLKISNKKIALTIASS